SLSPISKIQLSILFFKHFIKIFLSLCLLNTIVFISLNDSLIKLILSTISSSISINANSTFDKFILLISLSSLNTLSLYSLKFLLKNKSKASLTIKDLDITNTFILPPPYKDTIKAGCTTDSIYLKCPYTRYTSLPLMLYNTYTTLTDNIVSYKHILFSNFHNTFSYMFLQFSSFL